jgi:DUF4097 and DUF4098 domain-containing protein YvlB
MSADDETMTNGAAVPDEEIVADYDVRSPASRTLLTVVGTILAVTVVAGLVLGFSILKRSTTTSTSDIEVGRSAQIVVDAGESDLRIVQGTSDVVRVSARITSGLRKTDFDIGRRGDQIKIVAGCQTWLNPGCGVDTTLEIPKGFPVVVRTTSGDVSVRDIAEGVLTIQSGSGDVRASGLKLDELAVQTGTGDISASFAAQPFAVKATSREGDITATLADGKRTYDVTATSKSGDVSSSIDSDDDGAGFIRATTDSGDITLSRR